MINNIFSPKRFGLYLKKEFFLNFNSTLIAMGSILGLLFLFFAMGLHSNKTPESYMDFLQNMYILGLFGGGLIYTSSSFKDLNQQGKSYFFLSLPASSFEKFFSALFLSSVVWSLLYTALFFIFAGVAGEIRSIYHEIAYLFIDFRIVQLVLPLKIYFIANSLFLLGAATFKGRAFIKTGLTLFLIVISISCLYFLSAWIFLNDFLDPNINNIMNAIGMAANKAMHSDQELLSQLGGTIGTYGLAPLAWVIAYFKLKEREI